MAENLEDRVSVLIPARNEEANIERAVRSVATQRGVREIIVVDDQSKDRTGEILERLGSEFPSLRTIRIESLPAGWMGKANALATASRAATGEWFLFTDADTEHRPG
ncbi:MAG TPA: glycosyltransferase family 2 protein, partial [Terriglobia bacterium]|nr:glycosyltransferase family 2 protein [Terriglobia bacterium]